MLTTTILAAVPFGDQAQAGAGWGWDSVSKEEMGHGEGQSKLRSRKRLSCKNYCERRTLAREPGCARVCVAGEVAGVQPAWWLPGELVSPGPPGEGRPLGVG